MAEKPKLPLPAERKVYCEHCGSYLYTIRVRDMSFKCYAVLTLELKCRNRDCRKEVEEQIVVRDLADVAKEGDEHVRTKGP